MWRSSLTLLLFISVVFAGKWPYNRYEGFPKNSGLWKPNKTLPEFHHHQRPQNLFASWLRHQVKSDSTGQLKKVFINGSIPHGIGSFDNLLDHIDAPTPPSETSSPFLPPTVPLSPQIEAAKLFEHLPYPIDPRCTVDRSKFWYRTYDGSCNWMKAGEISEGQVGTKKSRDYNQYAYADGISKPRDGPNPRAVSNAFFKRKRRLYYEHTPLLLGLIEFIMHDVSYSQDSITEFIDVPVPDDEDVYSKNTTFRVWRTEAVPGTGTSRENPRENINMASTWLDVSALYGSTPDVAAKLRSFKGGKLLTQELQTRGGKTKASYLPFNTMNVPTRTRPGVDPKDLFAGGDPRTNEDWVMLGVHTLLLREHNRLCDILAKQHPEYDDERLYQTIRLVMAGKFALIANSYQMAYWTDEMPWPRDDGFPLYRQMSGEDILQINPANTYPWPLVTKGGKPMVVSTEMAIVYRFHEFIIPSFSIKDALNDTIWEQDLFGTGFNATGFIDAGLENVLRGMTATHIPNFKSGVDEAFRSAGQYRGQPFDIVTWSIVHEREQGLPTFNTYFRAYNKQDPEIEVPIRDRFEDFSSDPEAVANLKRLYKTPNDVDLVVGVQLDEEMFPGTTVPKTALIISLFSLFGMGNSDRFSVGFAIMRCLLVDKPWDCHPSNALEELLWAPKPRDGFPNFRFFDQFWLTELDFQAHGTNLLWRLVTENSDIKCLQKSPLFPFDPVTNPILCSLPSQKVDVGVIIVTALEVLLALAKQNKWKILTALAALALTVISYRENKKSKQPPVLYGWPIVGKALDFQKDPKKVLLEGFEKYGNSPSKSFGIKLANLTHFVLSQRADLENMMKDNPYEVIFNLHEFLRVINFSIITRKENFDSDLHTKLIRNNFGNPETVKEFTKTVEAAAKEFLKKNTLTPENGESQHHNGLNDFFDRYITYVVSRCIVGPDSFDNEELMQTFMKFNDHATQAMGLASLLPSFLQFIAAININKDFKTIRKILIPVIQRRRLALPTKNDLIFFLDFILDAVPDDTRAADLVAVIVFGGLTNLQSTFSSTVLDIFNIPSLQSTLLPSLSQASASNINVFSPPPQSSPWSPLRAAMFESIRLCGPITGPARIIASPTTLSSDPKLHLPKGQAATLSSFYTHRDPEMWGANAACYKYDRFVEGDPPIGMPEYIPWGLKGPHTCPGRWFAMTTIQVMTKELLVAYDFVQDFVVKDEEKYIYSAGNVKRLEVGVEVTRRV